MNAILRDDCEATVLTNEAIEVHLSYLRPAVEALGEKLDQLNLKVDAKLGELNQKIDGRLERVDEKMDQLNQKIDQNDKQHIDRASRLQGSVDGLKWFVSSAALLASAVSIAHTFDWI